VSPAERGLIVIAAKNDIDHDSLWSIVFADEDTAIEALKAQLLGTISRAEADRRRVEWDDLFKGKCVRPILFMAHTVVKLPAEKGRLVKPTSLQMMLANGALDPVAGPLSEQMNWWLHYIRSEVSSAHDGFPR
jgi:hypothetical protein